MLPVSRRRSFGISQLVVSMRQVVPNQSMFGWRSGGSLPQGPPGYPGDLGEKRTFSTSLCEGPLLGAVRVLDSSGSSFLLVSG